jgi:hypothetical protein
MIPRPLIALLFLTAIALLFTNNRPVQLQAAQTGIAAL